MDKVSQRTSSARRVMFKATLVASLLASIASVRGHGYVETIVADGTEYSGYLPYSDPYYNPVPDRIVRPIPGNGSCCLSFVSAAPLKEFQVL